jgi:hypothetical protein
VTLGERDETRRTEESESWVRPADQGLEAGDRPVDEVHRRLIGEDEFVLRERSQQLLT